MAKKFRHQLLGLFFFNNCFISENKEHFKKVTKLSPNVRDKLIIIHDDITPSKDDEANNLSYCKFKFCCFISNKPIKTS